MISEHIIVIYTTILVNFTKNLLIDWVDLQRRPWLLVLDLFDQASGEKNEQLELAVVK